MFKNMAMLGTTTSVQLVIQKIDQKVKMSFVIVTQCSNTKWMINHIKIFTIIAIEKVVVQVKMNTLVG